jgi:4-amino-4-deoxy-L-arabinose transferase-like glycosyltransferase
VALATLLGLVVRLWAAGRAEVWIDEAYSALLAVSGFGELLDQLRLDNHPPLYYLALKGWAGLTSLHPLVLRLPSVLLGAATVPALWLVGSRMDRPRVGVAAAWLLALHPLHVFYSQEIRSYALLVLLALGLYYALFHVLARGGRLLPALLLAVALAYSHYYGLVFVATALLVALVVLPARRGRIVMCGTGVALAYLPWLPVFLAQLRNPGMLAWMAPFWERYPGGFALLRSAQGFLPGGQKYPFVPLEGLPPQFPIVVFGLVPFLWVGVGAFRERRRERSSQGPTPDVSGGRDGSKPKGRPPRGFRPLVLPLVAAALPLLVLVVRSYLSEPVYLVGRSDVIVLPLVLLALAWALARMPGWGRFVFLGLWAALCVAEIAASAPRLQKPGNARLAAALDAFECSTVVAEGYAYAPMAYYEQIEPSHRRARVVAYPLELASHPGHYDPSRHPPEEREADAGLLVREHPPGRGLCVIAAGTTFSGPLARAYLSRSVRAVQRGVFTTSLLEGVPFVFVTFEDG